MAWRSNKLFRTKDLPPLCPNGPHWLSHKLPDICLWAPCVNSSFSTSMPSEALLTLYNGGCSTAHTTPSYCGLNLCSPDEE